LFVNDERPALPREAAAPAVGVEWASEDRGDACPALAWRPEVIGDGPEALDHHPDADRELARHPLTRQARLR
jgi:hypothetical protein